MNPDEKLTKQIEILCLVLQTQRKEKDEWIKNGSWFKGDLYKAWESVQEGREYREEEKEE